MNICYPVVNGLVECSGTVWTLGKFLSYQRKRWGHGAVTEGDGFVMVCPGWVAPKWTPPVHEW